MTRIMVFDLVSRRIRIKNYTKEPKWVVKYRYELSINKNNPNDEYEVEEMRINIDAVTRAHPEIDDVKEFVKELVNEFIACTTVRWYHNDYYESLLACLNKMVSNLIGDGLPYHEHRFEFTVSRNIDVAKHVIERNGIYDEITKEKEVIKYVAYTQ